MKDAIMHGVENLTCTMMNHAMHFSTRPMMTFKIIPLVTRMVFCKLNYFIWIGSKVTCDAKVLGIGRRWRCGWKCDILNQWNYNC
jgi:hypothetical protein